MTTSQAMLDHLAGSITFMCPIWKITTTDDYVAAYCLHTRSLLFNGVTYKPAAMEAMRPVERIGLQANSVEISGVFDELILRCDVEAGYWRDATVLYEEVNYLDLTMGSTHQIKGTLGKVEVLNKTAYKMEFLSQSERLQPLLGQLTSPIDRNNFPANVNEASYTQQTTITDVIDRTNFKVSYVQSAENYYKYGVVLWSAANSFYAFTTTAFQGALSRNPTGTELSTWNTALFAGWDVSQTALQDAAALKLNALFGSAEYIALNTTNQEFIEDCYEAYLGRASDPSGRYFWLSQIGFLGRTQICLIFGQSAELAERLLQIRVNVGLQMDVKSSVTTDGGTKTQIEMQLPLASVPHVGDTVDLVAGYDGTREQARDKYSAMVDFDGEPDLPGLKKILRYPE